MQSSHQRTIDDLERKHQVIEQKITNRTKNKFVLYLVSEEPLKLSSNFFELQLEMNELKERLEIEKQGWIENYMKKQVQNPSYIPRQRWQLR